MTRALYYEDPNLFKFEAKVLKVEKQSDAYQILLDQTAFYPEGGGQPADIGWLNEVAVKDVQKVGDNIFHITDVPLPCGQVVSGKIDVDRRRDYSVQHTAQHLFSQCFLRVANYPTVSVHFGEQYFTIEFDTMSIPDNVLSEVEDMAREIIAKNLPVKTYWIKPEEAGNYNIRRTPPKVDKLRIVEISEFEYSTCGGTHVDSTGKIGIVKIISREKIRGQMRVKVLAGNRAYSDYHRKIQLIQNVGNVLTSGEDEIFDRIKDLVPLMKEQKRKILDLEEKLFMLEIPDIIKQATVVDGVRIVAKHFENKNQKSLNTFIERILSEGPSVVLAVNILNEKLSWIFVASEDLDMPLMNLINPAFPHINGKGGGKGNRLQGGGTKISSVNQFIEHTIENVERELKNE